MKKIEFGFATEDNPRGSWEGMGIKPGLLLSEAEYIGTVGYQDDHLVIFKVVKDDHGRFPQLLGKYVVSDALYDTYADGSGILFLDMEQSKAAENLQQYLNTPSVSSKIQDIDDVIKNSYGVRQPNRAYKLLDLDETIVATSINHEAFTAKNEAVKNCRMSLSEMQMQLSNNNNYTR